MTTYKILYTRLQSTIAQAKLNLSFNLAIQPPAPPPPLSLTLELSEGGELDLLKKILKQANFTVRQQNELKTDSLTTLTIDIPISDSDEKKVKKLISALPLIHLLAQLNKETCAENQTLTPCSDNNLIPSIILAMHTKQREIIKTTSNMISELITDSCCSPDTAEKIFNVFSPRVTEVLNKNFSTAEQAKKDEVVFNKELTKATGMGMMKDSTKRTIACASVVVCMTLGLMFMVIAIPVISTAATPMSVLLFLGGMGLSLVSPGMLVPLADSDIGNTVPKAEQIKEKTDAAAKSFVNRTNLFYQETNNFQKIILSNSINPEKKISI